MTFKEKIFNQTYFQEKNNISLEVFQQLGQPMNITHRVRHMIPQGKNC